MDEQQVQSEIQQDYLNDRKLLEQQIEHLKLIEQKLNGLILDLEAANLHLQSLLQNEKDPVKKKNYHTGISYNIERLTKLYGVLREYQDTKFKYINAVNDVSFRKNKLLHHDLVKISSGSTDNFAFYNQLMSVLSGNKMPEIEIEDEEQYKI